MILISFFFFSLSFLVFHLFSSPFTSTLLHLNLH